MKQPEAGGGSRFQLPPLLEHLAFGCGTLLAAIGPVLAGMDMISWMAIFMGINAGVLILLCLLGAWNSVTGSGTGSRRRR